MHPHLDSSGNVSSELFHAVENLLGNQICRSARYLESTASTNSDALADLSAGRVPVDSLPRLYLTDQQTDGRGRQGNSWLSDAGGLTFSLALTGEQRENQLPISMVVGVALAQAIEYLLAPLRVWLKWPNDIYLAGGKVGGILVETNQTMTSGYVVGVGINVNSSPNLSQVAASSLQHHPGFLSDQSIPLTPVSAVSLAGVIGRKVDRGELLLAVVQSVIEATETHWDEQWLSDYRSRCCLAGKTIALQSSGDEHYIGRCVGIGAQGQLVVETAAGRREFRSGQAHEIRAR